MIIFDILTISDNVLYFSNLVMCFYNFSYFLLIFYKFCIFILLINVFLISLNYILKFKILVMLVLMVLLYDLYNSSFILYRFSVDMVTFRSYHRSKCILSIHIFSVSLVHICNTITKLSKIRRRVSF